MDVKALLIACWRLTESYGRKPSIKATMRMARAAGGRFDEHEARALLRPFAEKSTPLAPRSNGVHPDSTPQIVLIHPDATPAERGAPISKRGSRARDKVLPVTKIPSPNGDGTTGAAPSEPEWVESLRHEIGVIDGLTLSALSVEQRVTLGRYHAFRFENFTRSEQRNKNRGSKHVAALADLGATAKYGDVTVAEYRAYMHRLFKASDALIRSPWALKGAIEDEP